MTEATQDFTQGLFIRGIYLGVEESSTYTPRGEDREVKVKPKIGVSVNGEEVAVRCRDDAQMAEYRKGLVKGDPIELAVEASPPFGARGSVGYSLPGAIVRRERGWK